jgi:hypothetical protein
MPAPVLGRHVRRGPGEARGVLVHRAGEPEIGHPDPPVLADEHVLRLEVAVDDARPVRGGQPLASGAVEGQRVLQPGKAGPLRAAQGLALHVLHGEEDLAVEGANVVDGDDVRVGQPGDGLRLGEELGAHRCRSRPAPRPEELDGHLAVELGVEGAVDHAHPTPAHGVEQHVASEVGPPGQRPPRGLLVVLRRHQRAHHRGDQLAAPVAGVDVLAHPRPFRVRALAPDVPRERVLVEVAFLDRDGHGV